MTLNEHSSKVSFLLPVYNEAGHVGMTLKSILFQDYPTDLLEVVIALAPSNDSTESVVRQFMRNYPALAIQIVANPGGNTAYGRNLCLAEASGGLVMNFSGHAVADPDLVSTLVARLADLPDDVAGIGCGIRPRGDATWISGAIASVIASPLGGSGSVDSSYDAKRDGAARSVAFTLYKSSLLERFGGFDAEFWCGQDAELNLRLAAEGHPIWFTPATAVEHFKRSRVRDFVVQMWKYGIARAKLTKKHPRSFRPVFLLPVVFTILLLAFVIAACTRLLPMQYVVGLLSAFCICSFVSTASARGKWLAIVISPVLYTLLYVSYGIGFLRGLLPYRFHP